MKTSHSLYLVAGLHCILTFTVQAFVPIIGSNHNARMYKTATTSDLFMVSQEGREEETPNNRQDNVKKQIDPQKAFPVISKIAGIEWTGSCRYVNAQLIPLENIKLSGGVKYDIQGTELTLNSFLTFPNGKTRQVVMKGSKDISSTNNQTQVITMNPVEEDGPIVMKVSEIYPDTILINEVEKESGETVMTTSLNIVQAAKGMELVGVSHEVGKGKDVIEGHQIWRMTGGIIEFNDFDYRDATGR